MNRVIARYFSRQSVIEKFFLMEKDRHPYRDCWKFYNQNLLLTAKQIDTQSLALSYGLLKLGFRPGDKLTSWLSNKDYSDSILLKLACARIGLHVHSIVDNSIEEGLGDAKGVVFSPWEQMNGQLRVDYLLDIMPSAPSSNQKFPHLKHFIQSGTTTLQGMMKLKDLACPNCDFKQLKSELDINLEDNFFTIQNTHFTQQQIYNESIELVSRLELKKGDLLINSINQGTSLTTILSIASLEAEVETVFVPNTDPFEAFEHEHAKVLIVEPQFLRAQKVKKHIDLVVFAGTDKKYISETAAELHKKHSISFNRGIGINPITLEYYEIYH